MKFSLHLSTRIHHRRDELPLLNYMTDLALGAEDMGFDAVSLTEHHLHEHQGYQNSLLFASALAPRLKNTWLVLATVSPALHHPLRLVESLNLIDQLSGGRMVVGLGSGFKETDLIAFGRDPAVRDALFDDGVKAILDIWNYDGSGGPLDFRVGADHGRIEAAANPSSFRKPHPILGRGTFAEPVALEYAKRGWAVLTGAPNEQKAVELFAKIHAAQDASGQDAETIRLAKEWSTVTKAVHVAETDEQAVAEAMAFFAKNPGGAIARRPEDMICGSVETVTRAIRTLSDGGVGNLMCGQLIDLDDTSVQQRALQLMKAEVIPAVKRAPAMA